MAATLTRQELERAFCWEADDNVPRQPAMTGVVWDAATIALGENDNEE